MEAQIRLKRLHRRWHKRREAHSKSEPPSHSTEPVLCYVDIEELEHLSTLLGYLVVPLESALRTVIPSLHVPCNVTVTWATGADTAQELLDYIKVFLQGFEVQ